ncbi:hypothetical protein K525DRAFT_248119 [Schizophyllum commune Loenen D]|nr:hypothetical protein K525DRAFT_248119 [Schizophyllum commune Loenen D]
MTSLDIQARTTSPLRKGLVNLPGATPQAAALTQRLLQQDFVKHHCFFNEQGFHNHLPHHLLSVLDLGGSAHLLQSIYDTEAAAQRPATLGKSGVEVPLITEENWTAHLGKEIAYAGYLQFFSDEIAEHGAEATVERFVFSPEANGNGSITLARLGSAVFHPWIQLALGLEFKQDFLVAAGLSLIAMTEPAFPDLLADTSSGLPSVTYTTNKSLTLHELFEEVYASDALEPGPYDPEVIFGHHAQKFKSHSEALSTVLEISKRWKFPPTDDAPAFNAALEQKRKEAIVEATLFLGATGLKHDNRGAPPRVDFFLMHLLTSSMFMQTLFDVARKPEYQARLLQVYIRSTIMTVLARGRPKPDVGALYKRAVSLGDEARDAIGTPATREAQNMQGRPACPLNAWSSIIDSACHHSESHVAKAARALLYAAKLYETEEDLGVVPGVDGTVFLRAATVLIDGLGWVSKGEKELWWDLSAVGWDEAWVPRE